jgi:hypothetical protein
MHDCPAAENVRGTVHKGAYECAASGTVDGQLGRMVCPYVQPVVKPARNTSEGKHRRLRNVKQCQGCSEVTQ